LIQQSAIDEAAGGKYKPGLSAYRDEMHIQEAFDKGMTITSGARTGEAGLENRPEAWAKWVNGASDREIEAARFGARVVIDNHIGTIRQAGRAGADIPDAPFTRSKLEMLFGKKETDRLVGLLADERAKAETNVLLTRQSVTARAQAAQRQTAPREVLSAGEHVQKLMPAAALEIANALTSGIPGLGLATAYGIGGVRKAGQKIGRAHDIATNDAYAHIASTTVGNERNALIAALRSRETPVGEGNKVLNALRMLSVLPFPR